MFPLHFEQIVITGERLINVSLVITESKYRPNQATFKGGGGGVGRPSWLQLWFLGSSFFKTESISTSKPHQMLDDHRKTGAYLLLV